MKPRAMMVGIWLYGLASVASGLLDFVWGNFDPSSQPIQAFSDHVPGQRAVAYFAAAWLVAGGLSVLLRKTSRLGSIALVIAYTVFAIFWLPRFWTALHYMGHHLSVYFGVFGGVAEELILAAAGSLVYAQWATWDVTSHSRIISAARGIFGLCAIDFGLAHLSGIPAYAGVVPKWMPLGPSFWVVLTGIAFLLAGLAILFRVRDILAASLTAAMLLVFSILSKAPLILAYPHDHGAWGTNVYNITAVAAFWILASGLARLRIKIDVNRQS